MRLDKRTFSNINHRQRTIFIWSEGKWLNIWATQKGYIWTSKAWI